jgi:hypothetical protein
MAETAERSKTAEALLEDLSTELEVPGSRYEAAERSYKSLTQWLGRPDSIFANKVISVYPQGSFRLGTVIRPGNDTEHYDLDIVCELNMTKGGLSQAQLKRQMGSEIEKYADAYGMGKPEEARRCWTLNYADEAQFHMDILPAVPDGKRQRMLIGPGGLSNPWIDSSVAITDKEHVNYLVQCDDWPTSNPLGYSAWFRSRMKPLFDARRQAIALKEAKVNVEEIPEYRVKTPLQAAIQILKRHRDVRFKDTPDVRPISIIVTTLAAHAYSEETTISGALYGILGRMDKFIEYRDGIAWISNPTDPRENFADKWQSQPERKAAFFDWLEMVRADFARAASLSNVDQLVDALSPRMGRSLMEAVANKRRPSGLSILFGAAQRAIGSKLRQILDAPHRKPLIWPELANGIVSIKSMTVEKRDGFRTRVLGSDDQVLPKRCSLTFEAKTNVTGPFNVYWQVVNTGDEARIANGLRGGFYGGSVESGRLTRTETTLYSGSHSIECLIIKNGYCVARSGPFVVNIG